MVDDDLNMVALPETRNIKSIVTAEDRLCIERKNKQAVQRLAVRSFHLLRQWQPCGCSR